MQFNDDIRDKVVLEMSEKTSTERELLLEL